MRLLNIGAIFLVMGVAQVPAARAQEVASTPAVTAAADLQGGSIAPATAGVNQADSGMQLEPDLSAAMPGVERSYLHVFVAFAATFALLLGYAVSVGRRFGRLEEEVRRLNQR